MVAHSNHQHLDQPTFVATRQPSMGFHAIDNDDVIGTTGDFVKMDINVIFGRAHHNRFRRGSNLTSNRGIDPQ